MGVKDRKPVLISAFIGGGKQGAVILTVKLPNANEDCFNVLNV